MDVPVTFNICERQHATEEGDAAKDYEEPANYRDRQWPPFHMGHSLHAFATDLLA